MSIQNQTMTNKQKKSILKYKIIVQIKQLLKKSSHTLLTDISSKQHIMHIVYKYLFILLNFYLINLKSGLESIS